MFYLFKQDNNKRLIEIEALCTVSAKIVLSKVIKNSMDWKLASYSNFATQADTINLHDHKDDLK